MNPRGLLWASWIVSSALLGIAIFSTPYMRKVLAGEAVEGPAESLFAFSLGAVICGWPWFLALALPPSAKKRQIAFGIISSLIAVAFVVPIATGHDFSIGLNLIFAVLAIWIAYPCTRVFGAA